MWAAKFLSTSDFYKPSWLVLDLWQDAKLEIKTIDGYSSGRAGTSPISSSWSTRTTSAAAEKAEQVLKSKQAI